MSSSKIDISIQRLSEVVNGDDFAFEIHGGSSFDDCKILLDELDRLQKENFAFAAGLCPHQYGDDYGHSRCKEIDRLHNALKEVDVLCRHCTDDDEFVAAIEGVVRPALAALTSVEG